MLKNAIRECRKPLENDLLRRQVSSRVYAGKREILGLFTMKKEPLDGQGSPRSGNPILHSLSRLPYVGSLSKRPEGYMPFTLV